LRRTDITQIEGLGVQGREMVAVKLCDILQRLSVYSMFIFTFWHSGNLERTDSLHDNTLSLSVPLMHEVDSSING